jgi:hypothetical protein
MDLWFIILFLFLLFQSALQLCGLCDDLLHFLPDRLLSDRFFGMRHGLPGAVSQVDQVKE